MKMHYTHNLCCRHIPQYGGRPKFLIRLDPVIPVEIQLTVIVLVAVILNAGLRPVVIILVVVFKPDNIRKLNIRLSLLRSGEPSAKHIVR